MELRSFPNPQLLYQIRILGTLKANQPATMSNSDPSNKDVCHSREGGNLLAQNTPKTSNPNAPDNNRQSNPPASEPVRQEPPPVIASDQRTNTQPRSEQSPRQGPISVPVRRSLGVGGSAPNQESNINATNQTADGSWQKTLEQIKQKKTALYAILKGSQEVTQTEDTLQIKLKQDFKFFREKLNEEESQKIIQEAIQNTYQKPLKFTLSLTTPSATNSSLRASENPQKSPINANKQRSNPPAQDPIQTSQPQTPSNTKKLNQIIAMFDGAIIE